MSAGEGDTGQEVKATSAHYEYEFLRKIWHTFGILHAIDLQGINNMFTGTTHTAFIGAFSILCHGSTKQKNDSMATDYVSLLHCV